MNTYIGNDMVDNNTLKEQDEIMDSYEKFFSRFAIEDEDFYNFGLEETIFPDIEQVRKYWEDLKRRLSDNERVYIRGAGRDARGTQIYLDFYSVLFRNNNIKKDPNNNTAPKKIIQELTGYNSKTLLNYQISHIFAKTKNPLLFESPWNIVYVPKIIDPFTGHEASGKRVVEYQRLFLEKVKTLYKEFIEDYNNIVKDLDVIGELDRFLKHRENKDTDKDIVKFKKGIIENFEFL
jgi:hypothetical protein